jgi:PD-(D/E)XK endonuclease
MEDESTISQQQDAGSPANILPVPKNSKERGESAEIAFLYKASNLGFGVAKPYGDSQRYDFILRYRQKLWKVQVKSTRARHKGGYQVHARGSRYGANYTPEEIDFLVAYIVPEDVWYVVPIAAIQNTTLGFFPSGRRPGRLFEKYREAWHLMMPAADLTPAEPVQAESSPVKDALE